MKRKYLWLSALHVLASHVLLTATGFHPASAYVAGASLLTFIFVHAYTGSED